MASARVAELQLELTAAREESKAELKEEPTNFAKIDVYKDLIHNLTEELKTYSSTTDDEQELWIPAVFAIPWLLGQQVRQKRQQMHQTKENGHQIKSKKSK